MSIPAWADVEVSKKTPELRACGEGQNAEFKADFPPQVHSLAEEVAAFATSGGGLILIGVDDDGNVVGLDESQTDKMFHRAQGIVAQVQPKVKQRISLCYDGGFILVIDVAADQPEPVYYYGQGIEGGGSRVEGQKFKPLAFSRQLLAKLPSVLSQVAKCKPSNTRSTCRGQWHAAESSSARAG